VIVHVVPFQQKLVFLQKSPLSGTLLKILPRSVEPREAVRGENPRPQGEMLLDVRWITTIFRYYPDLDETET